MRLAATLLLFFSICPSFVGGETVGYTPGWVRDVGQTVKPRELFGERIVKGYHFFFAAPSTRAMWAFQTEPIARAFQSNEAIFSQTEPPPGEVFTPSVLVVFDDYSTASIETSPSDWVRITYLRKSYLAKKSLFSSVGGD